MFGTWQAKMRAIEAMNSLRDQLDRVKERIRQCPIGDPQLGELDKMRRELTQVLNSNVGGMISPGDSALTEIAQGLIYEGACSLLLKAPIP